MPSKFLQLIRSIIFLIVFAAITIPYGLFMSMTFILPLKARFKAVSLYPRTVLWCLKTICGLDFKVVGQENIPTGPAIIYAKHQSTWETLALQLVFPPACFVAKKELLKIPFFGWGMAAMKYITIDRSARKKAMRQIIDQATDRFKLGLWVIIFPEGTRREAGATPSYKAGGARLSESTGKPLVPVALNSGDFWPRHGLIKWPGTITLEIGPVINPEGRDAEQIQAEAKAWIEGRMAELHQPDRFLQKM